MLIRKWIVCYGVFFIISTQIGFAEGYKGLPVILEGAQVSSEISAIEKNNQRFVNLPFLRRFFHIATSWNPRDNQLYFKFGNLNFKFYGGQTTYYVNGKSRTLSEAPFEKNGDFWVPLEFFTRLGLNVQEDSSRKVAFEWSENYLLGVENIVYQDSPAFLLVGARNFTTNHYTLHEPERLVCEIPNFKPHFVVDSVIASKHPLVKQVRIKPNTNGNALLVFELKKPCSFNIMQDPKQPNASILAFNYSVDAVSLTRREGQGKLGIKTSQPAQFKVYNKPELKQMIIKFFGATLNENSKTLFEANDQFRSLRVNQDDLNTVSVTLDLATNDNYVVTPSSTDPSLLVIKKPGSIKAVEWSKTNSGSLLTVTGDTELTEKIRLAAPQKRLQLDFDHVQFDPGLNMNVPAEEPVKAINLLTVSPNLARIEIDFNCLAAYEVTFSPDRHVMSLHIKNSPLIGRTIVLDPGHGGPDTGACGKQNTREKDVNLETTLKLKNLLEQAGAEVLLTRNSDSFIGLYERGYFANYHKAELFVSIHSNSHPDPAIRGIEVFHYTGQAKSGRLAEQVLKRITQATGFKQLGVKCARFVVIRETQMPSVLVELGFLSNYQEESLMKTTDFREKAALGIFQGIVDYYLN